MAYDIKITGGTIIDGTGNPGYPGDVGIKDGRVVALGNAPDDARQILDAAGQVVCPGFVDIHTHYDAQVLWDPLMTVSPWHGVTTVVVGNCGFGVAPTRPEHRQLIVGTLEKVEGMSAATLHSGLGNDWPFETFPEYLDAIEQNGLAINLAALVGHTPIRLYVMGEEATEREATTAEVTQMRALVDEALNAGALGFATSQSSTHVGFEGRPVPSRAASFDEINHLAGSLAGGRGVMQATVGKTFWFDEFEKISQANDCNITWTALLPGFQGKDAHVEQLQRSADLIAAGHKVYPQVSCIERAKKLSTPIPNFETHSKPKWTRFGLITLFWSGGATPPSPGARRSRRSKTDWLPTWRQSAACIR